MTWTRRDRGSLPLHLDLAEHLVIDGGARQPPGLLTDEHPARSAPGLDPCCGVDGITDHVRVVSGNHDLAGVDPDSQTHLDAMAIPNPVGDLDEAALELQTGAYGSIGVVLRHVGDAEARHHAVADELDDRSAVPLDDVSTELVVGGQLAPRRLGVDNLTERGRADEVGEYDRHRPPNGAVLRGDRWHVGTCSRCAAFIAELGRGGKRVLAGLANAIDRCAAFPAELRALAVLSTARRADHNLSPDRQRAAGIQRIPHRAPS